MGPDQAGDVLFRQAKASLLAEFRLDFCSRHLPVLEAWRGRQPPPAARVPGPERAASGHSRNFLSVPLATVSHG
jgi:hypothetical protein